MGGRALSVRSSLVPKCCSCLPRRPADEYSWPRATESGSRAEAVDHVIGMSDTIDDEAAIAYAAFPGAGRVSETSSSFDRAKEAIRAACAAFDDKGGDFERVTRELLGEFGFFNLRRQLAGQQFGRDLSGMLEEPGAEASRWYFECKNLRDVISTGEVAPKLIWRDARPTTRRACGERPEFGRCSRRDSAERLCVKRRVSPEGLDKQG